MIFSIRSLRLDFPLVFCAVAALGLFVLSFPTVMTSDGMSYIASAKLMNAGSGYSDYDPETLKIIPQIGWPPLFSISIAAVMKIAGLRDIYAVRVVNFLSLIVYYLSFSSLIALVFKEKKFQRIAHGLILISSQIWSALNMVLSEPLFTAWFGVSLVLAWKAVDAKTDKKNFLFLFAGLATAMLCLTRYSGVFIAAAYGLFFLFISRYDHSIKRSGLVFFAAPIVFSAGGWFLRNSLLSGHMSFLDTYHTRHFFHDFFLVEAGFIRTLIEALMGFSMLRWQESPILAFLPVPVFLCAVAIVAGDVWTKREKLLRDPKSASFLLFVSLIVVVYVFVFNFLYLKNGLGNIPRYFQVLCPVVFLAALMLVSKLGGSLAGRLVIGFLVLSSFFHGVRIVKEIQRVMLPKLVVIPGVTSSSFVDSPWMLHLFGKEITNEDVVITNDQSFLNYAAGQPCRITNSWRLPHVALEEVRGTSRNVYVILDKKRRCIDLQGPDWEEYLGKLRFEKIGEDDWVIAVRLIK